MNCVGLLVLSANLEYYMGGGGGGIIEKRSKMTNLTDSLIVIDRQNWLFDITNSCGVEVLGSIKFSFSVVG